ncbi:LON peptidase substrate-binding domain-containing protein [Thermomonas flagellata]|uniref:LON peptidase substrate-binding domain-containing protein n=1 Tax=Thermomonas flagellata TaxID=2888524 RepID=UPI001F040354|nr:LON peptidase substrate-binding domain-containing protein [Thermomonas flagellata]
MPDPALLPLFPLRTVLVPGGVLDLRIFERRYLDMVAACGRGGHGFGVCLILAGEEVGAPATPAEWGTEAVIEDFGQTPEGLLALRVRGHRRFRAGPPQVRPDGLLQAEVAWRPEPQPSPRLRPEHALLAELLRRILAQAGPAAAEPEPALFEDAAWVGWRLAEWLPLSAAQRLHLLRLDDPHARLQALLDGLSEEPAPG